MQLLRGITGIYGPNDDPPVVPTTDLKAFRLHCYHAASAVGANVQAIKDRYDGIGVCNFAVAYFEVSDTVVALLLNVVYPVIAFANCPVEGQIIFEYVDCQKLAEEFRSLGEYTIATCSELNQPLVRELWKDLSPVEAKRIRYFRPARIGDVIFNYWD
jgi:hypothetical protein